MDRLRYALLRAATFLLHWSKRRLTPAGQVGWVALVAAAALGIDTNQSMAYQGFTFLAPLILVSWFAALRGRARFEVTRVLPRLATAGKPLAYRVALKNSGTKVLRGASLTECVADPRPDFASFRAAPENPSAPWVERFSGYARWRRLIVGRLITGEAECVLPDVLPGGACDIAMELVPSRRGILRLRSCELSRPETMGLFKSRVAGGQPQQVLVLPRRYPVGRIELGGGRRYQQGGVSLASRVGDSPEFMALRDYRPGDALRRIHWRSWAKTGKPVVKEYQDEYFTRHALALDTFVSPGGEDVFEDAVSVAASLACSALTQESLLDMLFVGAQAYCLTAGRGLGGTETLLEALACAEPCSTRPFSELRAAIEARRSLLSGCVCVLLAFDDERRALVASLRKAGVPVMAMVVATAAVLPDAVCAAEGLRRLEPGRIAEGLAGLPATS